MRSLYYNKQGMPIDLMTWALLMENKEYSIIKQTRHKENGREFWLSTVWLGLDHSYGGPALIFETMALEFKPVKHNDVIGEREDWFFQDRYSTEDEAIQGHDPWRAVVEDKPDMLRLMIDALFGESDD